MKASTGQYDKQSTSNAPDLMEDRPIASKLSTGIAVYLMESQLLTVLAELQRHAPKPNDDVTPAERLLWSRSRGAIKGAFTHLENLTKALRPIERGKVGKGQNVKESLVNWKRRRCDEIKK